MVDIYIYVDTLVAKLQYFSLDSAGKKASVFLRTGLLSVEGSFFTPLVLPLYPSQGQPTASN